MEDSLEGLREKIQDIDTRLVTLLKERMRLVRKIAHLKRGTGLPILDADREKAVLSHVLNQPHAEIGSENLLRLFHTILDISRNIQEEVLNTPQSITQKDDHVGRI